MENTDTFGSSTAPLTWHDFLERMRQPSAADFVKAIKSFIVSFLNKVPNPEKDSAAVQEFLRNMEAAFRAHSLWAGCSEEELESAGEGLEKYVMTKLFSRVFASLPEDVKVDGQLHDKMALIQQFIRPENLDIKPTFQNETSWLLAQKELQKINMYKAPRDKLVCILNCCKVINNLLLNATIASNENPPGADEFLPVLIYVTIKANPPQLHSNLMYIQRYRRQTRLVAEAAYYFTNMLSAESFISNIDANSLSMDETEFEKNMESAQALLSGLSTVPESVPSEKDQYIRPGPRTESVEPRQTTKHQDSGMRPQLSVESFESKYENEDSYAIKDRLSLNKALSVRELENKGASILMKDEKASELFQDFPYLYSRTDDLAVGDVQDLLSNYKQLVFKYVCLSKGLGVLPPSARPSISQVQMESTKESKEPTSEKSTDETHQHYTSKTNNKSDVSLSKLQKPESEMAEVGAASLQADEE